MTDARARAQAVARAVLYEGYALYPYGAPALKNRVRVSLGELVPGASLRGEVVVDRSRARFDVELAFLQPVSRRVFDEKGREVETLDAAGARYVAFSEGRETRSVRAVDLTSEDEARIVVCAEPLEDEVTLSAGGRVLREAEPLACELRLAWREPSHRSGVAILSVEIANRSAGEGRGVVVHAPHLLLSASSAAFHSSIDPAPEAFAAAATTEGDGLWPVLAGPPGDRSLVLLAPMILYDHLTLAPESTTAMFDATENDELLALSILALSDDEKRTMAATDPRCSAILEGVERLGDRLGALHGAARSPFLQTRRRAKVGDRVLLRPLGRDAMDPALGGKSARVVDDVTEVTGRAHLVVVLDDDPGRDLGEAELGVGHRFFVSHDEVELAEEGRRD